MKGGVYWITRFRGRWREVHEPGMPKLYWEDFKPGAVAVYGPRLVTREEIVAFAAEFDPQPMHLDEAAASTTLLGGLGASGWHSCCLLMRMICDGFVLEFDLDGRARRRRGALAQAAAAGHAHPRSRHRAGDARLQQPAGNGLSHTFASKCSTTPTPC